MKPKLFEMPDGETLDLTNLYSTSAVKVQSDGVPIIGQTTGKIYSVRLRFTHHTEGHEVRLGSDKATADAIHFRIIQRWSAE